jgi:type I restriction enzyme S subunit
MKSAAPLPRIPLGQVCRFQNGGTPSKANPAYWSGDIPWITSADIREGRVQPARSSVSKSGLENSAATQVTAGTLLLVTRTGVGKSAVAPWALAFSQDITALLPDDERLETRYLQRFLDTNTEFFARHSRGATIKGITREVIESLRIPLPPLDEQKRIAAILDAADALRAKRRESIEQLDSLIQATFLEMFGDPVTNPKGWAVESLGQVASNEDGKRVPVKKADREKMQGRYPYYGASGVIDHVDDYLFEGQRLLIGEDGANLLARSTPIAFRANGQYWVNNHAHVLAENGEASLVFLETLINRLDLTQYVSGSAQPKLTQKSLNAIPIPTPPLDLQARFASIVESIEQQKARQKAHLTELDALFASLQSRAFNGELVA